jgi:hypothetical protein
MRKFLYLITGLVFLCIMFLAYKSYLKPLYHIENMTMDPEIKSKVFEFDIKDGRYTHNSSIIQDGDTYILFTRLTNFNNCSLKTGSYKRLKDRCAEKIIKLQPTLPDSVLISRLDKNMNILGSKIYETLNNGHNPSDIRAFRYNSKIYLIGTNEYQNGNCGQALIDYSNDNMILMNIENNGKFYFKNWSPIEHNGVLYFVHINNPLTLVKPDLKTGKCDIVFRGNYDEKLPKKLSGSTPFIPIGNNKYLGITHINAGGYQSFLRNYVHYFTIIDMNDQPYIEKISKSICFSGDCGIEFVMGIIENIEKDGYIITYGKDDCDTRTVVIPKHKLWSYFE